MRLSNVNGIQFHIYNIYIHLHFVLFDIRYNYIQVQMII